MRFRSYIVAACVGVGSAFLLLGDPVSGALWMAAAGANGILLAGEGSFPSDDDDVQSRK